MRYGVLGTGMVGRTLADKLVSLGHEVVLGSRTRDNTAAVQWAERAGPRGRNGTFAEAAAFGETVVNATAGTASLDALAAAGSGNLEGKVLIDVANPLHFSQTGEVWLDPVNTDSLGEEIQRAFPTARVVKTLNTVNHLVMVDPARAPGEHNVFLAGDDTAAKATAAGLLRQLGWPEASIVDLGDITAARATEMLLPLWVRVMGSIGHADFNFLIQRAR